MSLLNNFDDWCFLVVQLAMHWNFLTLSMSNLYFKSPLDCVLNNSKIFFFRRSFSFSGMQIIVTFARNCFNCFGGFRCRFDCGFVSLVTIHNYSGHSATTTDLNFLNLYHYCLLMRYYFSGDFYFLKVYRRCCPKMLNSRQDYHYYSFILTKQPFALDSPPFFPLFLYGE